MADSLSTGPRTIAAIQLGHLRSLLGSLRTANSFYEKKLGAADIDKDIGTLEDFSLRCPFTTKEELVADHQANPPYGTNLTFPVGQYTRIHQTSGTTGKPLRWLDTPDDWQWMVDSWKEIFRAADVDEKDRVLFAFSFGPFIGFWLAFDAATQMGCLCFPGGGLTTVTRLRILMENEATVLCCTPTYALRLAEVAGQEGIDLKENKLRKIIVAGEPGGSIESTRKRLEEAWDAQVFDHHGMTEVGPVTYQWEGKANHLKVMEEAYYAEVIKPGTNDPVTEGEEGELILTALGRTGSPLIRYRTGDLVRPQRHEEGLLLAGGILGRTDDMVIVRGVNVYPSAIEHIMRSVDGVAEYQVITTTRDEMAELSLRVEPTSEEIGRALTNEIETAVRGSLGLRVPVEIAPADSLPRFELKAKRWIKE